MKKNFKPLQKVLIANRGEIAVRIIRACHDMGLQTVAVYSQADAESLHVLHADEAICIGEPSSQKSYLKIANILSACEITGARCDPSRLWFFKRKCQFCFDLRKLRPQFHRTLSSDHRLLGDKAKAKATAKSAKCPVIPGSDGVIDDVKVGCKRPNKFGYPDLYQSCRRRRRQRDPHRL